MAKLVRQLRNGQITIPKEYRDALGLRADDLLSVTLSDGKLEVAPVRVEPSRRNAWVKELYDFLEPVRKSFEGYSEQQVNDLIDEALAEVRAEQD